MGRYSLPARLSGCPGPGRRRRAARASPPGQLAEQPGRAGPRQDAGAAGPPRPAGTLYQLLVYQLDHCDIPAKSPSGRGTVT